LAALLGFGAVVVVAGSASAAGRVAALVPQIRPPAAPELRDRFHEAVTRGLQSGTEEVIPAAEVRLRLGASDEMLNCNGVGGCVPRAVQALRADHVVTTDIDQTGKDYVIKLRLLDPVGRELAKVDEPCDICTVKDSDDAVARAAGKLMAAARTQPEAVAPKPEAPPPVAKTEPPPPPKVETPPQAPPPAPPPPPTETPVVQKETKHFPWRPVAIASLSAGLVMVVAGIPLMAIDGQPTCSLPNPRQSCSDVYNTMGGGATLLTLGVLGAAASGVMFYFDHKQRKQSRPTVWVTPLQGGAFLATGGRF
jgi:hypothetical protein